MKILCVFGRHNYGAPERGEGYEYTHFIPALRRLGHEVAFLESWNKDTYTDFADLNRSLLKTVERERPDAILFVLMGYEVWLETLEILRQGTDALLIHWSTDDSWKYSQFSRFVAPAFDAFATTYRSAIEQARRDGLRNFVLTQWAANAGSLAEPLPAGLCRYQVSFVGSAYGNRPRWINALRERGIEVDCFGHGWKRGPVDAEAVPRIMRESVISLNFGDSGVVLHGLRPVRSRQLKARIFEVPGAGGFLLTEGGKHLAEFYAPGKELVVFEGIDDLAEKIRHYLAHPEERDRIARAGFLKTHKEHTYEKRFQGLFAAAVELHAGGTHGGLLWGGVNLDFDRFAKVEASHRPSGLLRLLKQILQAPCILLWGRHRGPRAARRLLHEISWRMSGPKTFSASGWPGRIFYRES